MASANVKLSKSELLLVCDEQFILTKNIIIDKVYELFGLLSEQFKSFIKSANHLPIEVLQFSPKIYKGEQYQKLPYVMLDYPRCFGKEDVFAIRCLFWWGNFFSITLHMSGKYANVYRGTVQRSLQRNETNKWYVCVNEDHWEHHFKPSNYLEATKEILEKLNTQITGKNSFLKIAKKIPLQQWDEAYDFFIIAFQEILEMLLREDS